MLSIVPKEVCMARYLKDGLVQLVAVYMFLHSRARSTTSNPMWSLDFDKLWDEPVPTDPQAPNPAV